MPLFQCRHCGLRFRADTWDEVQAQLKKRPLSLTFRRQETRPVDE